MEKERIYRIPMEMSEEAIRDFGIPHEDIVPLKIGSRRTRGIMVAATREEYEAYMRPLWREEKRRERHVGTEASADYAADTFRLEIASETNIEAETEQKEMKEKLRAALARLPEADREILKMLAEGKKTAEIAAHLSVSTRAVRYKKEAALSKLRKLLQ